jgi:hypothetical protein
VNSAAASLLFGIVLMQGVHTLAKADWDIAIHRLLAFQFWRARRHIPLAGDARADAITSE